MLAVILAGGFGTRLQGVINNVPKPMAPIKNQPFLAYLLQYLKTQGIERVVLSTHYLSETIRDYFQHHYAGISIEYSQEEQPLGTGGAIVHALQKIKNISQPVFVLNGDTFLKMNYREMYGHHCNVSLSMALREMEDCSRYGKVITANNTVCGFKEKGEQGKGLINAGVYLIQPDLFLQRNLPLVFSFEKDFLIPHLAQIKPRAFVTRDYFIDIGVPEDYTRARVELPG